MKKRSLFVAVAMLIVSAIVLTSATYAWFAAGATATVEPITANAVGSDNSIVLSANATDWYSTMTKNLIIADSSTETFPTDLTPVDWNGTDFMAGVLQGSNFSLAAEASSAVSKLHYTIYAKSLGASNVTGTVTPAITFSEDFVYCRIIVTDANGTRQEIYNTDTTSYQPLELSGSAVSGTAKDKDSDGVIETGEDLTDIALCSSTITPTTTAATGTIAIQIPGTTAGGYATIDVTMWAEGQDYDCHGSANGSASSVSLTIA